jgi:hypothetical protein
LSTKRNAESWGPESGAPQSIACLQQAIRRLVAVRQTMRDELESNRLAIGRLNRQLSQALIDQHHI